MHEMGLIRGTDEFKALALFTATVSGLHLSKPIDSLDDVKGRKIRTSDRAMNLIVKTLGATPVAGSAAKIAQGISRGLFEGSIMAWNGLYILKIDRVTFHHVEVNLGAAAMIFGMSHKSYNKLSARAKAAVDKHSGEVFSKHNGTVFENNRAGFRNKMLKTSNHVVVTPTPEQERKWRAKFKPLHDNWIQSNADGQKRYDALIKILADIRAGR
jgi:TRAP-type C4-dicarboxylate transport system substrate-binding protein